jgi:flavin-dependent dehydrogenase
VNLLTILTQPTVLVALSGCVTAVIVAAIAARVYSRKLRVRELELKVEREKVELVRADLERRRLLDLLFYLPEDTRLLNRVSAIRSLLTSLAEKYMDVETRMTRLELEAELKRLEELSKSLEKLEEEGGE